MKNGYLSQKRRDDRKDAMTAKEEMRNILSFFASSRSKNRWNGKRIGLMGVVVVAVLRLTGFAQSSVPELISYQGVLSGATGQPLTDSMVKLAVNMYDASSGGNKLWGPQTFPTVVLQEGRFNSILGPTDDSGRSISTAFTNANCYIGITVAEPNGDLSQSTELAPRQRLLTTPYAFQSKTLVGRDWSSILVSGNDPAASQIAASKLEDNAITSDKLAPNSVGNSALVDSVVFLNLVVGTGTASGQYSVAEGYGTLASGTNSHAEGQTTTAGGQVSHAEGLNTHANGNYSHAEGVNSQANGDRSHAEGDDTRANGFYSHAEGSGAIASGLTSHAEGYCTTSSASYAHAEGVNTAARGWASHAEGVLSVANGERSHAEGDTTTANGFYSHAEGSGTIASGQASHAEGESTRAIGLNSHAEGRSSVANGDVSHAEGSGNHADGAASHAEGYWTVAGGFASHAAGQNAHADHNNSYVWGDGSGTASSSAQREYTVLASGGIRLYGNAVYFNGSVVHSSDRRLKKNIALITNALGKVEQINGVYYEMIAKPGVTQVGVIAQDVEKVLPEVVLDNPEGYKSVDYSKLTALLIEAVKELKAENAVKDGEISELRQRVTALERK